MLGRVEADFGIRLGWHLQDNGSKICTELFVLEVKPGCPADKAGMEVGDFILEMNGECFRNRDARREIMRSMASLSPDKEVAFKVRNNLSTSGAYHLYHRREKRGLTLTPASGATRLRSCSSFVPFG